MLPPTSCDIELSALHVAPATSHCPKCTHCKIHTGWTGNPSPTRALHNAWQCTGPNSFDKSKRMIRTKFLQRPDYPKSTRCSSSRCRGGNLWCSSGCSVSKNCSSSRSETWHATIVFHVRMFAIGSIGLKSAGGNGHDFFSGNMLNNALHILAPWFRPFTSKEDVVETGTRGKIVKHFLIHILADHITCTQARRGWGGSPTGPAVRSGQKLRSRATSRPFHGGFKVLFEGGFFREQ